MKNISVSFKIKVLGSLLITAVFVVIGVSIYLNEQNVKDATIVNIAGKQRMLTQRISKNVFFLYQTKSHDFVEMDNAVDEFNYGLNTLKNGNSLLGIPSAPTKEIANQISKVIVLWTTFQKNTNEFKNALLSNDIQKLNYLINYTIKTNNKLLDEVDEVVTLYTKHIEEKTDFIKKFQYVAFCSLFILALYSLLQLRQIEINAREFIEKYKVLGSSELSDIKPIQVNSEKEFIEMADNMNSFISKVNSVVSYSESALVQSELASKKLESLSEEFSGIIEELEGNPDISKQIYMSEDIAIESSENLQRTTKKLNVLKSQLNNILTSCESSDKKS